MSGRIRTIKPELLEDAVTAGLSDTAFRIFIAAILLADDYGCLRFESAWLQGQVFWARSVDPSTFAKALSELSPLVNEYSVNGQRYGAIRNWSKHQRVSHPGKPRVPGPPESLPPSSGESRETRVPDLRSPIPIPIPISDPDQRPPRGSSSASAPRLRAEDSPPPSESVDSQEPASKPPTEAMARYQAAYAAGVTRGKASPWVWPGTKYADWDLGKILKGHAKDPNGRTYRGDQLLRFIEATAAEFTSAVIAAGKAQYYNAFEPRGCLRWLNEADLAEEACRVG